MITQQQQSPDSDAPSALEFLSACMDGELPAGQRDSLLAQAVSGQAMHAEWNLYHCIGDVLRSEELACHPTDFQAKFAAKLAAEPHVFAPRAAKAVARNASPSRASWVRPASLAASMAAVAVVAGVAMQQWNGARNAMVASSDGMVPTLVSPSLAPAGQLIPATVAPTPAPLPGAYLAAHRQFASQRTALYIQTVAHDGGK